jgi:hyperosmotically inducible protein
MKPGVRAWLLSLAAAALPFAIGLAPSATRADASDPWTTLRVKLDLIRQQGLAALDLGVDTEDGLVTLHGTAPSDVERAKSESIARGIGGTRPVRNLVQVVPDAGHEPISRDDAERTSPSPR